MPRAVQNTFTECTSERLVSPVRHRAHMAPADCKLPLAIMRYQPPMERKLAHQHPLRLQCRTANQEEMIRS